MATMTKLRIHLPAELTAKLDALKAAGYTKSGFIRAVLERALNPQPAAKTPRKAR